MKRQVRYIFILLITLILSSCFRTNFYDTTLSYNVFDQDNLQSEMISFEYIYTTDSMGTEIIGTVFAKDKHKREIIVSPIFFTNITIVEQNTKDTFNCFSDFDGKYQVLLDSGIYKIRYEYICYNSLEIHNIELDTGASLELNVILGEGSKNKANKIDFMKNQNP